MTELAVLTISRQQLAEELKRSLSHGNRIRVALIVTPEDFGDDYSEMENYLKSKNTGIVLVTSEVELPQEVLEKLASEFVLVKAENDSADDVLGQVATAYFNNRNNNNPESTPDQQWARTLKVPFEEKTVTPPPPPVGVHEEARHSESGGMFVPPPVNMKTNQMPQNNQHSEPMPPTYLLWSVLSIVFCCFIPAIVAVIFSSQVSSRYYAGDIEGARKASRNAEIWIIVSFVLGVLSATLYLPLMLVS